MNFKEGESFFRTTDAHYIEITIGAKTKKRAEEILKAYDGKGTLTNVDSTHFYCIERKQNLWR